MIFQPARFTIDIIGTDIHLDGYTAGETWNGWDCPYFTFEQSQHVVDLLNKAEAERAGDLDTLWGFYDPERDAFVFYHQSQKDSQNPEEDWDMFPSEVINGKKVYPIGSGSWIWERSNELAILE